ncbi:MAG TPA: hypothetical protein VLB07_03765 [Woeseiaceae bacterium]|nr:hypothetical protein [Woeseiaceae bacterium]
MSERVQDAIPRSFWIISWGALVWNLLGVASFVAHMTVTEEALMKLPEAQRMFYESMPAWANGAFAAAVIGGLLGSLLLLLRKLWAVPVFVVSLAGVLGQHFHAFVLASGLDIFGGAQLVLPALVLIIAVFLVWYSRKSAARAWIA